MTKETRGTLRDAPVTYALLASEGRQGGMGGVGEMEMRVKKVTERE